MEGKMKKPDVLGFAINIYLAIMGYLALFIIKEVLLK